MGPPHLTQHLGINAAVVSRPSGRLHTGQSLHHLKHSTVLNQAVEFIAVDHVLGGP